MNKTCINKNIWFILESKLKERIYTNGNRAPVPLSSKRTVWLQDISRSKTPWHQTNGKLTELNLALASTLYTDIFPYETGNINFINISRKVKDPTREKGDFREQNTKSVLLCFY